MLNKLHEYMSTNSMVHQVSCPYTPQQKGKGERRNHLIGYIGLSLLFHSKVPHEFWLQSFQTTFFILNRRSSSILSDNMSPC